MSIATNFKTTTSEEIATALEKVCCKYHKSRNRLVNDALTFMNFFRVDLDEEDNITLTYIEYDE